MTNYEEAVLAITGLNGYQIGTRALQVSFINYNCWPSKANSAFHPLGSVNEYQLRLGKLRQVWFIPLADERGVCR